MLQACNKRVRVNCKQCIDLVLWVRTEVPQGLGNILMKDGTQEPKERVDFIKSILAECFLLEIAVTLHDRQAEDDWGNENRGRPLTKVSLVVQ